MREKRQEGQQALQYEEDRLLREAQQRNWGIPEREHMYGITVFGPPTFRQSVRRVLWEAEVAGLKNRLEEARRSMPRVVFDPTTLSHSGAGARSNGLFAYDGGGDNWRWFRHAYWHEVGHNVAGRSRGDWSETAANAYANTVLAEIDDGYLRKYD